jgi:hypothetical protein
VSRRIKGFEEHRRRRHGSRRSRRGKGSDGSIESVHRTARQDLRDWQTDAYRSQSGRREADVVTG